jgi:thiamine-monophosphate kinase
MNELGLVSWIVKRSASRPARGVRVGPGDDCAVLSGSGDDDIHVTIDEVVEGTHFRLSGAGVGPKATGRDVGYKALATSVSDLAAMGARPRWAIAAAALRRGDAGGLGKAIYEGLCQAARDTGCPLVGGNIAETRGARSVSVAAFGVTPRGTGLLRSTARAGDLLYVTGDLGGSILGRHLRPTPRLREGEFLRAIGGVSAMMDVSDGLALDLGRLCDASRVGALVVAERLPVSRAAAKRARRTGATALEHALSDGEDYELLFAVSPRRAPAIERRWRFATRLTCIGEVCPRRQGLRIEAGGTARPLARSGFTHL